MADNEVRNQRKAKTGKSALGLVGLAVVIIVVIVAAAWALSQPGVLEDVLYVVAIIIVAIVVIAVVAYAVYALVAIPMYALKGEQYQEGVDYSIEDVKPVEGKSLDDKKE